MRAFSKSAILQRLQTLQNGLFGSKIKMAKNLRKPILRTHQSCSVQKTAHKNTKYSRNESILKIGHLTKAIDFAKWLIFGEKLKWPKTSEKGFYEHIRVVLCKNPLMKTPNIREMREFVKLAILQRLQTLQNGQFGAKIKMGKNMQKTTLRAHQSCSVQKTAHKNTKYSRHGSILKIGHLTKAIDYAKWSVWVKS